MKWEVEDKEDEVERKKKIKKKRGGRKGRHYVICGRSPTLGKPRGGVESLSYKRTPSFTCRGIQNLSNSSLGIHTLLYLKFTKKEKKKE